jgi:hypothetical protein
MKKTLRKFLIITAVSILGMLGAANEAAAAPSAPPDIISKPGNPNTTQVVSKFSVQVGSGETEPVETFECRAYLASNPPAPEEGWQSCGNAPGVANRSFQNLANGTLKYEVRSKGFFPLYEVGPIASYTWVQNLSLPSAPVLTDVPPDPNTTDPEYRVHFDAAEGEVELVDRFQCRLDEPDWNSCDAKEIYVAVSNGEHKLEVRAGNQSGYGDVTSYEWTHDIPEPSPSVDLSSVSESRWVGTVDGMRLGGGIDADFDGVGMSNLGDVDGDGTDDLFVNGYKDSASPGHFVLLNRRNAKGTKSLGELSPSDGYKVIFPGEYLTGHSAIRIGDQNGDGVPDMAFTGYFPPSYDATSLLVIYGVRDPSQLPLCPGASVTRCLDMDGIPSGQGYLLRFSIQAFAEGWWSASTAGDFDGDGTTDIMLGGGLTYNLNDDLGNRQWIIKGGDREGTVTIDDLPADQTYTITDNPENQAASAGMALGGTGSGPLGDLNDDGYEDIFVSDAPQGGGHIVFGRPMTDPELNVSTADSDDGFRVYGPVVGESSLVNIGDVNSDGITDFAGSTFRGIVSDPDRMVSVIYGVPTGSDDLMVFGTDIEPGRGYTVGRGGLPADLGYNVKRAGDLNNDGLSDVIASAPRTPINGIILGGAAYLLFSQTNPQSPLDVGPELTSDLGVALLGDVGDDAGRSVEYLGDLDEDGLPDYAVGSPGADDAGKVNSGAISIVPGKNLVSQVRTQAPVVVGNESAVLSAGLATNNRDSEVWFEYGTSDEYGSTTESEEFEGSNNGDAASAAIDGLEKGTEYHYRAVAKNALGLVRYGDDKTFTTTNTADPDPVETCDLDPTGPGCAEYCQTNPTAMGCPDFDWCAANPGKCNNGGTKKTNAKLGLITTPKTIKVKRGKKGSISAIVFNSGGKTAHGVKVCVKAPKTVKVKKCQTIGGLGAGKTKTKQFKVKVTKKAKKGKKITLKFTASSKNAGKKTATVKVKVG